MVIFKRFGLALSCITLLVHAIGAVRADDTTPVLRALILSDGRTASTPILRQILVSSGRFHVRVCETPVGLSKTTLDGFDLVVDDVAETSPGSATEAAISGFVASGKGVVVTQGALLAKARQPTSWRPSAMIAPSETNHFLELKLTEAGHSIFRDGRAVTRVADAVAHVPTLGPMAEVLATVQGDAGAEPVLWTSRIGAGRSVGIAFGHDEAAMHENFFRAVFAASCEWAANGTVAPGRTLDPVRSAPEGVKALLITGGHDHDAAFYRLFAKFEELESLPVDTSATAFKKDLRGKYDVIVMYDFSRALDEVGQKNLHDFVDGGGGIVVLHHALLNYQDWSWWDDDVVGGSYRLTNPSSRVKDDQQIYATPVGDHPVTRGLAPFHIQDEAYKNLRMSPKFRPLLTTDNPTSDTNLAWVGPSEKARVVAIQLGHGRSAFEHPSYRTLVHNAMRWAANKTK